MVDEFVFIVISSMVASSSKASLADRLTLRAGFLLGNELVTDDVGADTMVGDDDHSTAVDDVADGKDPTDITVGDDEGPTSV